MESNNKNDIFDSLFFAAAQSSGKEDIAEYNSSTDESSPDLSPEVFDRILELAGSKKSDSDRKSNSLSLRRKLLIVAAAALLVCSLAVSTIAGRNNGNAKVSVSEQSGMYVLTFDTRGFKAQSSEITVPEVLSDNLLLQGKTSDGAYIYKKDNEQITFAVKSLDSDYSHTLGRIGDVQYFEILIKGEYNGCAYTTEEDGEKTSGVVWNDGKYAYELYGNAETDRIIEIAQGTK